MLIRREFQFLRVFQRLLSKDQFPGHQSISLALFESGSAKPYMTTVVRWRLWPVIATLLRNPWFQRHESRIESGMTTGYGD